MATAHSLLLAIFAIHTLSNKNKLQRPLCDVFKLQQQFLFGSVSSYVCMFGVDD